jgi:dihydrofolate reductase
VLLCAKTKFFFAKDKAGLIDKFHLFINPVAIRSGMAIFKDLHEIQKFTMVNSTLFDCGIIELHYQPMRN